MADITRIEKFLGPIRNIVQGISEGHTRPKPISREEHYLDDIATALEAGGGGGGTSDYTDLSNKPSINGVTLNGDKTLADFGNRFVITLTENDGTYTVDKTPQEVEAAYAAGKAIVVEYHVDNHGAGQEIAGDIADGDYMFCLVGTDPWWFVGVVYVYIEDLGNTTASCLQAIELLHNVALFDVRFRDRYYALPNPSVSDDGYYVRVNGDRYTLGDVNLSWVSAPTTGTDEGKVLTANVNGEAYWQTLNTLPSSSVSDEGKVLAVNSAGFAEWAAPSVCADIITPDANAQTFLNAALTNFLTTAAQTAGTFTKTLYTSSDSDVVLGLLNIANQAIDDYTTRGVIPVLNFLVNTPITAVYSGFAVHVIGVSNSVTFVVDALIQVVNNSTAVAIICGFATA